MKRIIFIIPFFLTFTLAAQTVSKSFELRYFTNDPNANGETDFKGETEWKAYGYKEGQDAAKQKALDEWRSYRGASIVNGALELNNTSIIRNIDSLSWRFKFEVKVNSNDEGSCRLSLGDDQKKAISLQMTKGELSVVSVGKAIRMKINNVNGSQLTVEGDFTQKRFNLIVDGQQLQYYIPMADTTITSITRLMLKSEGKVRLDDLFIFNYTPVNNVKAPYYCTVVLDENFKK